MRKSLLTLALGLSVVSAGFSISHWHRPIADFISENLSPVSEVFQSRQQAPIPTPNPTRQQNSLNGKPLPVPAMAVGATTACEGDSVQLTAPDGFAQYLWSNGATTQSIWVKTSGHYTVRVANGDNNYSDTLGGFTSSGIVVYPNNAAGTDSIFLFLNPAGTCPTADVNAAQSLVGASEVRIHGGVRLGGNNWQNVIPANDGNPNSPTRFTQWGNWWVKGFDPATYFNVQGGQTIEGLSFVLTGGAQDGGWFPKEGKVEPNCGDFLLDLPASNMAMPSPFGVTVNITPAPSTPTIVAGGNTTICRGDALMLVATGSASGSYTWSNGATSDTIYVSSAGNYSARSGAGSCISQESNVVTVSLLDRPLPVMVSVDGPTNFCEGDSAVLSAPMGYDQYVWYRNGVQLPETRAEFPAYEPGHYTVKVGFNGGCLSDTLGGFINSGLVIYPANATAEDSIYLYLNPTLTCPLPAISQMNSLAGADVVRIHSGAQIGGNQWQNVVSTTDGATEPLTRFNAMGNWWVKKMLPRQYYGVDAGLTIRGMNFLLNGGPPSNGWFAREGKVEPGCGDFFLPFPIPSTAQNSPFGVTLTRATRAAAPQVVAMGSLNLCPNGSVVLRVPGGMAVNWNTGAVSDTLLVTAAGSYFATAGSGACTSEQSNVVVVTQSTDPIPTPTISAGGSTTFCSGDSVQLTASGAGVGQSYIWSNGATSETITVKMAGIFTARVISGSCTSAVSDPITVSVGARPLPVMVTAAGPTNFCDGDSVMLSAPEGYQQYLWSTGETTRSIFAKTAGRYTVRVANGGCFSDTLAGFGKSGIYMYPANATADDSVYIFLNPAGTCPLPTANPNVSLVGADVVRYHSGATINGQVFSNVVPSNDAATEPLTRFENYHEGWWVKRILPRSYYSIAAGAPVTGLDFVLNGGPAVGVWFQREGKDVTNNCGDFNIALPIMNIQDATPFGVTITTNPRSATPTATALGDTTFCVGGSVQLVASGGTAGSYVWSNGATTDTITVSMSGAYTVRTTSGGCSSLASAPVNVVVTANPAPAIMAMGDTTFCQGGSVVLETPDVDGATYLWSNGATTRTISANASGRYSVQVFTNGCGSAPSREIQVTVNAKPLPVRVVADGPTTFCAGDSVVLRAPSGFSNYLWSNGATTQTITVRTSGNYTVRVGNSAGCLSDTLAGFQISGMIAYPAGATADDSIYLFLDPTRTCPLPAINPNVSLAGATDVVRFHGGVNLNGTRWSNVVASNSASEPLTRFQPLGNTGAWVKSIMPRNYFGAAVNDTLSELCFVLNGGPAVDGWFAREGKVEPGCTDFFIPMPVQNNVSFSPFAVQVVVNPTPDAPTVLGPDSVCANSTITLSASGTGPFIWSNGATTQTITVRAGSYTVRSIAGTCTSAVSAPKEVVSKATPGASARLEAGDLIASPANATYQWMLNGSILMGANSQTLPMPAPGNYQVIVTLNGCTDTSAVVLVSTLANGKSASISMYPNPAKSVLYLQAVADIWNDVKEVRITNMIGKEVLRQQIASDVLTDRIEISIDQLPKGTYMVQIPNSNFSRKLIVQ